MTTKRVPKGFLIRLDQGEELYQALDIFALQHQIQSGHISGIGMAREVELGYFDSEQAEYERKTYEENLEVLSISGTITELNDAPFFHIHGVFGKKDFSTIGGHVMKLVTDMTLEIFVSDFETHIERVKDEQTGLKLLTF
jgi:predicted DNA-binding protein with PD1-like motif